jgi:retron-type reverse transcriptase
MSMVKVILPEVYQLLSSKVGIYLSGNGIYEFIFDLNNGSNIWENFTRFLTRKFKAESGQPKDIYRTKNMTTWLPKGSNSYGNRAIIVPVAKGNTMFFEGRIAARTYQGINYYCTGSAMAEAKIVKKLRELQDRTKSNIDTIVDRDLYKLLCDRDIYRIAYEKLKSKPGNMTRGINPTTLDGMSIEVIDGIIDKLKTEKFQFTPGRRIEIPKKLGGSRPLTIAPPRDKLVQEAMRMIMDAIWDPSFVESSHGFRSGRSCHTALKEIKWKFQSSVWVIEGDISKCFDSIDHHKLMELIELKIKDRKFTRLIWKSIKAGYFEFNVYSNNIAGTPQGSIISPLLSNIFMDQLDTYVSKLKTEFDIGKTSKRSQYSLRLQTFLSSFRQ